MIFRMIGRNMKPKIIITEINKLRKLIESDIDMETYTRISICLIHLRNSLQDSMEKEKVVA